MSYNLHRFQDTPQPTDSWYVQSCADRLCGLMARVPGYRSRGPG
jgi:hypothetical protein